MKVKISSIVENQFPSFIRDEAPLLVEFIKQYFISQEYQGGPTDLITNVNEYSKIESLTNNVKTTSLSQDISFGDDIIPVASTLGFPDSYGLLKINSEIITYTTKTDTSFTGCVRGFSGIVNDNLDFATTESSSHQSGSTVVNLSILFLEKFLERMKKKLIPGFEGRELADGLDVATFIKKSKSFYASKGTDASFEILFAALYGESVEVIHPRDYLITPSAAEYHVSKNLVVESIFGNPLLLENKTLFQDDEDGVNIAKGVISKVEEIVRSGKSYYVLSLDYDSSDAIGVSASSFGVFSVHPKTQLTSASSKNSTTLDVDSTVGFPDSGSIIINNEIIVQYTSKSTTQFFGCSGVTQDLAKGDFVTSTNFAYGYGSSSDSSIIAVRITGVINDFVEVDNGYNISHNSTIRIKTLGKDSKDIRTQNWQYNIPARYDVESATLLNVATNAYRIKTSNKHIFKPGDSLDIVYKNGTVIQAIVSTISDDTTIIIGSQGPLLINFINYIERNVAKVTTSNFPDVNILASDVQNVYEDETGDIIVSAPSIPTYNNQQIQANSRNIIFNANVNGTIITSENHGFFNGDAVTYERPDTGNHLGVARGTYYVKKITQNTFSLASSRSNLRANNLLTYSGTALFGNVSTLSYQEFGTKTLQHQKLLRKISKPSIAINQQPTPIGNIGILNNGVEILNYKSKDVVFYGPIETVDVISPGTDYDVINPPKVFVTDETGSGLLVDCEVKGSLNEIQVIDRGLNFTSEPSITISGGNGKGAKARVELGFFEHSATFNSSSIVNNRIGFTTFHGFNNSEKVIYKPDGPSAVIGISTDSEYFVNKVNDTSISLHRNYSDSISGINTIGLSYSGFTFHRFISATSKTKISNIVVTDSGEGYTNRRIAIPSSAINLVTDKFTKIGHGFKTGEKIIYESYTGTPISGITTNTPYYVTEEGDGFKLSPVASVGITTSEDFFFKTKQFVSLNSAGIGTHYFNYEPIQVKLFGNSGVSTSVQEIFSAKFQPIFRGEITSVSVVNGGSNYGQEDILNYNRQPNINISSGSNAILKPIVAAGKIVQVFVINQGANYNSPPHIYIGGPGNNAKLVPIIENGYLVEVKVLNGGYGYDANNITLTVTPAGSGGVIRTIPTVWTINQVERLLYTDKIPADDGIIAKSINSEFGLQYTHGYAPRKLRQSSFVSKIVDGITSLEPDLKLNSVNQEISSDIHSPIIGWAYDGNPIYGPYGFDSATGGSVRFMRSGYRLNSPTASRPSSAIYPNGIFVEDYSFDTTGDLDDHNGRYCVTPEFPNGTYAYFATINGNNVENSGPFLNYYKPIFPYLIGQCYKSDINTYNFDYKSNQDLVNLNDSGWFRITTPFNLESYGYLTKPYESLESTATVTSTAPGFVESVKVLNKGDNYKIKDVLVFNNDSTEGFNARAEVSLIGGKPVNRISVASSSLYNVEFTPDPQYGVIGVTPEPYFLTSGNTVSIKNLTYNRNILQKTFQINAIDNAFTLSKDIDVVANTGITTYIEVYGNFAFPNIKENDVFRIDNEKVKILVIDKPSSRLFVERGYESTVGAYHTTGAIVTEIPRKFYINANPQSFTNPTLNREIYFNPSESLGVGLGTTVTFSNPGIGVTTIFVPSSTVYIPNHGLNTGERVLYKLNGGSEISVTSTGVSTSLLQNNTTLYTIRYSDSFVGFSTQQVGVGSTGNIVGYNTTSPAKILYFNTTGSGQKHSLITTYPSTVGQVDRNLVNVFTNTNSELQSGDQVTINVGIATTSNIKVAYNAETQRVIVNPRTISASGINTVSNTITVTGHEYYTGQKILYTATTPVDGLENNGLYFTVVFNSNTVGLSSSYYNSQLIEPQLIPLKSATDGIIYEVNPRIKAYKNGAAVFDLTDPSLSYASGSQRFPAFDFELYSDRHFVNEFKTAFNSPTFNVTKTGIIGVSTDAKVALNYSSGILNEIYYNLIPLNNDPVYVDPETGATHNVIEFLDSAYSGTHSVTGVGTTSFGYTIVNYPESPSYHEDISYTTKSRNVKGPIERVSVTSGGNNYKHLPGISSVTTSNGKGANFEVISNSIGRINNYEINDIGFDYPADLTLTPSTKTPTVLKIRPQFSLDRVGITSRGVNYSFAPNLMLVDGTTFKRIPDVDLKYTLVDSNVTVKRNSKNISNKIPTIVPVNNSNAIRISSISFNNTTKDVTVVLADVYNTIEEFPFSVGDKVLLENISILPDLNAKGYDSSSYEYARFTVNYILPNLGSSGGSIVYNLASYLKQNEYPGIYNDEYSMGRVTPEKYFPIFDITLTPNIFLRDEVVVFDNAVGSVQHWDEKNSVLVIATRDEIAVGSSLIGSDSHSTGTVEEVITFNSYYKIGPSSIVRNGWRTEKGFLDNEFQRISDNNYYQYFSYSLKSKVDYNTWNNPVSSLNHIAGFKKFSDFIIESESSSGINTIQDSPSLDLSISRESEIDLNCIYDFDLVTENSFQVGPVLGSNEIYFNSRGLFGYTESVGNRVLPIDDISGEFNGVTREFSIKTNSRDIFSRNIEAIDLVSNTITINNHYFTNGEKLNYSYSGSPIGITTTTIVGIGSTNKLPSTVYVIKYDESTIGLASSATNALKETIEPFVFTSVEIGSSHVLSSLDNNTRAIISLGGVIQSPIVSTATTTLCTAAVGVGSTYIRFSSVKQFSSGDFVKIDDEVLKITAVGIVSTNDVYVNRGWVGTAATSHTSNSIVYKVDGEYNIVNNKLHFTEAPPAPSPVGMSTVNPDSVDYAGITSTLKFNGRVFTKNGVSNTTNHAYYNNFIFDDISHNFNGITTSFNLTSNGQNITGFATNTGSILINQVFQEPSEFNGATTTFGNYALSETAGITSIRFLSLPGNQVYNVNAYDTPVGGVIKQYSQIQGYGLQPLVSAAGTAIVSMAGTIQSIVVRNKGTGYRSGLQTVNVGVYASTTGIATIQNVGIATISSGRVVSVAITNPGFGFTHTNPPIVKFDDPLPYTDIPLSYYSTSTGIGTGARANITVGMGQSIVDVQLTNTGFAYKPGDVLTIGVAGTVGIPTALPPEEFPDTWVMQYTTPVVDETWEGNVEYGGSQLFVSDEGDIYMLGDLPNPSGRWLKVIKLSPAGTVLWVKDLNKVSGFGGSAGELGLSLRICASGENVLIGAFGLGTGRRIICLDSATGSTKWIKNITLNLTDSYTFLGFYINKVTKNFYLIFTSYSNSLLVYNVGLVVLNGAGSVINTVRYTVNGSGDVNLNYVNKITNILTKSDGSIIISCIKNVAPFGQTPITRAVIINADAVGANPVYKELGDSVSTTDISFGCLLRNGLCVFRGRLGNSSWPDLYLINPSTGAVVASKKLVIGSQNALSSGSPMQISERGDGTIVVTGWRTAGLSINNQWVTQPPPADANAELQQVYMAVFSSDLTNMIEYKEMGVFPPLSSGSGRLVLGADIARDRYVHLLEGYTYGWAIASTTLTRTPYRYQCAQGRFAQFASATTTLPITLTNSTIPVTSTPSYTSTTPTATMADDATVTIADGPLGMSYFANPIYMPPLVDFRLIVDKVYGDKFSGWTFGELQIIDPIDHLFNGSRRRFPIKIDRENKGFRANPKSSIILEYTLLIFINGILQNPGESYNFSGSSFIVFTEAPKQGSTCTILFYRGNSVTDVIDVEATSVIEPGDRVKLNDDNGLVQNERTVTNILSSDAIETLTYTGPNVVSDELYARPIKICRQTEDTFIGQKEITKDREEYSYIIEPSTNLIRSVGVSSNILFVENYKTLFDSNRENIQSFYRNKYRIISQENVVPAIASANVSIAGTITSINLSNPGYGYLNPPEITIAPPVGLGTSSRATATASIINGSISTISITNPGFGYTSSPYVIIESPYATTEVITSTAVSGDFGIISGITQTSVGVASTGLVFNLYIPQDSPLRNPAIVGTAITVSGIQTGYYLVINNTFVGTGVTSLDENNNIISNGNDYLNNVYRVATVSTGQSYVAGVGTTSITSVTVSTVSNNVTGIGNTQIYGTYSWGRIVTPINGTVNSYAVNKNGLAGISTSPILKRFNPLKLKNYT